MPEPEWMQRVYAGIAMLTTIFGCVIAIMITSHFTASPPQAPKSCNGSGVHQVIKGSEDTEYDALIVCNNGFSFEVHS